MTINRSITVEFPTKKDHSHNTAIDMLDEFEQYVLGLFRGIVSRERRSRHLKIRKDIKSIRLAIEFDQFLKATKDYC